MSNIYFVHPESGEPQALEASLREANNGWEISRFQAAKDALDELKTHDCDVIVLSGKISDISLQEVVATLKRDFPRVARIVTAEDRFQEFALRNQISAHQFLSKPFQSADLVNAIRRACSLRDFTRSKSVLRVVSSIKRLPALPANYEKVNGLLKRDDVSIQDIADTIGQDVTMVAKILQIANSSLYGARKKPVSTVQSGVKMLGIENLKLLVLATEVFSQLDPDSKGGAELEAIWKHSFAVGSLASKIAATLSTDRTFINEALSAGILHDIGKVVLLNHFPDESKKVAELKNSQNIPEIDAELSVFGTTHAEIGGYLLGSWSLPHGIVEAVAYHHSPSSCFTKTIAPLTAVYFADLIEQAGGNYELVTEKEEARSYLAQHKLESELHCWCAASSADR